MGKTYLFAFCALLFALVGCKTQKTIVDTSEHEKVETKYIHDTAFVAIHDTTFVEIEKKTTSETNTTITFDESTPASERTYNPTTGVATGVSHVSVSESVEQYQREIQSLIHEKTEMQAHADSLVNRLRDYESHMESESKAAEMSVWTRFFYVSGWILWALLFAALVWFVIKILRKYHII